MKAAFDLKIKTGAQDHYYTGFLFPLCGNIFTGKRNSLYKSAQAASITDTEF